MEDKLLKISFKFRISVYIETSHCGKLRSLMYYLLRNTFGGMLGISVVN